MILIATPYWYGVETEDGQHGWINHAQLESRAMRSRFRLAAVAVLWALVMPMGSSSRGSSRTNLRPGKPVVEAAVRQLQASSGGRLPVLDGFAVWASNPWTVFKGVIINAPFK